MLVLARKIGQKIIIGNSLVVTVESYDSKRVKLSLKVTETKTVLNKILTVNEDLDIGYVTKIGTNTSIDLNTTITYLGYKQGKHRLGFDAPKHIKILREEIYNGQVMA